MLLSFVVNGSEICSNRTLNNRQYKQTTIQLSESWTLSKRESGHLKLPDSWFVNSRLFFFSFEMEIKELTCRCPCHLIIYSTQIYVLATPLCYVSVDIKGTRLLKLCPVVVVVVTFYIFILFTSQFQTILAQSIIGWRGFNFVQTRDQVLFYGKIVIAIAKIH